MRNLTTDPSTPLDATPWRAQREAIPYGSTGFVGSAIGA